MKQDRENASSRNVILILKDRDGIDTRFYPIWIQTTLPKTEIIPAVQAAAREFLNTPEGKKVWNDNCGNFNYGDFDLNVPNSICLRHGFYRNSKDAPDIIEEDYDITLAEPDEE